VVPATPYAPPVPEPLGDPLPQNMKAPLDEPTEMLLDPVHADAEPLVNKIDFPLITDLINRADAKQKAKEKAAKMVEAASMISDIDDDASEFLMTRAAGIEGPALSRLELEVLRLLEHL
jgi:hypothetical protein